MGSNQISFASLVGSMGCYKRPRGVVCEKGQVGVSFLSGVMCAEGIGWGRTWVIWVLHDSGTACLRPEVG